MKTNTPFAWTLIGGALVLFSCGGGGGADTPPELLEVLPANVASRPGAPVEFSARIRGTATSWEWSFGDGAYPRMSSESTPNVRLARPGVHTGTVRAMNPAGESETLFFDYTVNSPAVAVFDVKPLAHTGTALESIPVGRHPRLQLAMDQQLLAWTYRLTPPDLGYENRGSYLGLRDSDSAPASSWSALRISQDVPASGSNFYPNFAIIATQDRVMLIKVQGDRFSVEHCQPESVQDPESWQHYVVPVSDTRYGSLFTLEAISTPRGCVVAMSEGLVSDLSLFLGISSSPAPERPEDWSAGLFQTENAGNPPFTLSDVRGQTVLGIRGDSAIGTGVLLIAANPTLDPTAWTHAPFPSRSLGFIGAFETPETVTIAFNGGDVRDPGADILESGELRLARTTTFPPSSATNWTEYYAGPIGFADNASVRGYAWQTDLEIINGFPTITYLRHIPNPFKSDAVTIDREVIMRAFTPDPRGPEDWFITNLGPEYLDTNRIVDMPDLVSGSEDAGPVRFLGRHSDGAWRYAEADFGW